MSTQRVGSYEMGRTLGKGSFAKVKLARNIETGESVAIKILDKEKLLQRRMIEQIKREISTMKLIKHPNVVRLHEVLASKTKIYIVMEYVCGGMLLDKIDKHGRLREDEARKYFQQLINAVDYCHSRGVYHRDLKPENLLLDAHGNLKVTDFGLSALSQQVRKDGLLHTTCGTPNYLAPELIIAKGYDGATADLWSCGVILFASMAGYLPFDETNLIALCRKINKADFTCPLHLSSSAKKLLKRILDPNPKTRITIPEILENEWFKQDYRPPKFQEVDVAVDRVVAVFNDTEEYLVQRAQPVLENAFELITMSRGLNLAKLFDKTPDTLIRETLFTYKHPAKEIISKIEEAARPLGFDVEKQNYKLKLQDTKMGTRSHLSVAIKVSEVAPSLVMIEFCKAGGDTLEFHEFFKNISLRINGTKWHYEVNMERSKQA